MNVREVFLDDVSENELIHIRAHHAIRVVVTRQQLLDHRHQQPEGVLLLHEYQLEPIGIL